jgi:hypothetical protein
MFPDGNLIPVRWTDNRLHIGCAVQWSPESVGDNVTYFTELCQVASTDDDFYVVAGEGGLGSDGVIAVIDRKTDSLEWCFFMDNSNPFERVEIALGKIIATTNLGHAWTIDLRNPKAVAVALTP